MIRKKKFAILIAVFVLVVVCVFVIWSNRVFGLLGVAPDEVNISPDAYYPITYVVDGDTFKVDVGGSDESYTKWSPHLTPKIITIRVLGINTPETVDPRKPVECYGSEASALAKDLLNGHKVKLIFNPNRELKDKYDRYLAYVYRDDGLFYNEIMIKEGFAREYTYGLAYSMQKEFRVAEALAQKNKLGLWGACVKAK